MAESNDQMQVAVVGVGRMGTHHARTYSTLAQAKLVAVVDPDQERAATVADDFGCDYFTSVDAMLGKYPNVAAVTVAVPTVYHRASAEPLLERGVACLIEKPLAPTVEQARELAELARKHGTPLQVGHTERFNPAVRAVAAMDLTPRFLEVDRISPMTFRSLDVGVVMDMMIHDLDIVLMLAQSPIKTVHAAGVSVMGKHEDVANARIEFKSGCVANVTASRLALKTQRKLRLFSEQAYVSLDYQKREGIVLRLDDNANVLSQIRQQLASGEDLSSLDYSSLVHMDTLSMDLPEGEEDPLTAQLSSFLAAVRTGSTPAVDASAGYEAVAAAQQVLAAISDHHWEGLELSALHADEQTPH